MPKLETGPQKSGGIECQSRFERFPPKFWTLDMSSLSKPGTPILGPIDAERKIVTLLMHSESSIASHFTHFLEFDRHIGH